MVFSSKSLSGHGLSQAWPDVSARGLGQAKAGTVGTFSPAQNRAILITALTMASISLVVAMVSLRWFLSMKRSFRHHLILMLIISDTFKAWWYFLSPLVIFSRGQIDSSSAFSQASGFLLATGVEGADLSILFIALHTTLYIFRPPQKSENGGLYKCRYYIYAAWVALPLLAASLAFANRSGPAYVTTGTISYLPKRPFWYRLALAWIPRYIIFVSVIAMYTAIYVYVKVKFDGFHNFGSNDSSFETSSTQASKSGQRSYNTSLTSPQATLTNNTLKDEEYNRIPSVSPICNNPVAPLNGRRASRIPDDMPEWEKIDFITSPPLVGSQRLSQLSLGITAADFACEAGKKPIEAEGGLSPVRRGSESPTHAARNASSALTLNTNFTTDTAVTDGTAHSSPPTMSSNRNVRRSGAADQLALTRIAIRRQLRFLFIYPLVYLLLWILPFVQHCLNYTDYYTAHPQFWLNVCTTCILALQAGVDCVIFSWRERPWTRMQGPPVLSVWAFRRLGARFSGKGESGQSRARTHEMDPSDQEAGKSRNIKRDSNWWEEEGKKRKDSVWLGTDTVNDIIRTQTRQSAKSACRVE
jgi:G protein-coupled receptor GPR1